MTEALFKVDVKAPLYTQQYTFLEHKIACEWRMSPVHRGRHTCPRHLLNGDIAEVDVFGHGVSKHLWPAAVLTILGLILVSGFDHSIFFYASVPLFTLAALEFVLVTIKLRKEKWIYLLKNDGTADVAFCEDYIDNMTKDEFRQKYREYTSCDR